MLALHTFSLITLLAVECFSVALGQAIVPLEIDPESSVLFPDAEGSVTSFSDETSAPIVAPPPPPLDFNALIGGGKSSDDYEDGEGNRSPNGLEILVAIFFFVAAAWLLIAVFYALMALIVLRLRARGRLDLYDAEFGRLYLFGSQIYIPCGCILRRYVVAFGHDQPSNRNRSTDYRYISRGERRGAIEKLLLGTDKKKHSGKKESVDEEMAGHVANNEAETTSKTDEKSSSNPPAGSEANDASPEPSQSQNAEEPVCSICLAEYETNDNVFQSEVCDHMYHAECICDWLERRSNTECPCCRQPLVSESDVWETVKATRKAKEKQDKLEKKKDRRWFLSSKQPADSTRTTQTQHSEESIVPDDSDDEERGNVSHRRQETMVTFYSAEEQSSDDSIAGGDAGTGQNQTVDASHVVEAEAEGPERAQDAPSDEESSATKMDTDRGARDPEGVNASESLDC